MNRAFIAPAVLVLLLSSGCASTTRRNEPVLSDHDRARGLIELAAANISENDATNALISLNESLKYDASIADAYYLFALAYYQKEEKMLALQSAKKAIELAPKFSKAKNTLGRIQLDLGKYAEAEATLKEAASDLLFEEAYLPKANLGILYYKKMDFERAESYLSAALREGGQAVCAAAYYRGMIFFEKNRYDKALADFNYSTHNGCVKITEAHLAKGQTLIRMKRFDQARAKMLEIQQLFPLSDASDKAGQYLKEIP